MSQKKRWISAWLAGILLLSALSSCSESANSTEEENAASAGNTAQAENPEPAAEETEETSGYLSDDIPDTDFGGASVQFICPTWYNAPSFLYAEELNGEAVNDEFYNQRMTVQERFNAEINLEIYPDEGGGTTMEKVIHSTVIAGDDTYDLVYNGDGCGVRNGIAGDFLNLRSLSSLDFDKPWFKGTSDLFTIGGKLYFTANPLSTSSIYMNSVLAINKDMAADFGLTIPYDQARAGAWCFDDMVAMTADMNQDINGDGKMDENDQYGFLTQYYSTMCIQCNLGGAVIGKDEEGWLTTVTDVERIVSVSEKYAKLMENGSAGLGPSNEGGASVFVRNHSLFCYLEARVLSNKVRGSDVKYGILPFPKYDENQQDYAAAGYDLYWGIPLTSSKAEMTGTLVSAMSCYNYNYVIPLVWEVVLGSKLSDAPDDTDMFRIIRDTQYVDIGYACCTAAQELNYYVFLLVQTSPGTVASFLEKKSNSVEKALSRMNDKFEGLPG